MSPKLGVFLLSLCLAAPIQAGHAASPSDDGLAALPHTAEGAAGRQPLVVSNNTVLIESSGEPNSIDPAIAYDDDSGMIVQAVYETLVTYNGSAVDEFRPVLAEVVPTVSNGGITNGNRTYTFRVRQGVTFHSGDTLDADDVTYTLNRVLVIDDPGSPAWMLSQVLNTSGIQKVDNYTLSLTLERPYAPFLAVLAYTVGSVVSKETVEANGGVVAGQQNTWMLTHEDGTGPFRLERWTFGSEFALSRWPTYWDPPHRAKVDRVITRTGVSSSDRVTHVMDGTADIATIAAADRPSVAYAAETPGSPISVSRGASNWVTTLGAFNRRIDTANRSMLGPLTYPDDVPADFFADPKMREAFARSFQYDLYAPNTTSSSAMPLTGIIPRGMYGYNASLPVATFDLTAARAAYNASRWVTDAGYNPGGYGRGFNLTVAYNVGNYGRYTAALLVRDGVEALGPNIHVNVVGLEWSVYLGATLRTSTGEPGPVPLFFIGWGPDYADPDDYVVPFLRTGSIYPAFLALSNASLDALIDEASATPTGAQRLDLYERIQLAAVQNHEYMFVSEGRNFHAQNKDLAGWYYNPMLSGADLGGNLASLYWPANVELIPPTVSAGPDLVVDAGTTVWLNGTATDNDPGFPASGQVEWHFAYNGSNVTLAGAAVSFVFWKPGSYTVTLWATDASGNVGSDTMTLVIVSPDQVAPTVNAGGDITLAAGVEWTFAGFASDDDPSFSTTGAFGWRFDYNGSTVEVPGTSLVFTFWSLGDFLLTFWARDAWGNAAEDTRTATVLRPDTTPPTAEAGTARTVSQGEMVALQGFATDNDPTIAASGVFWWTFSYNGSEVNLTGSNASFTFATPGTYLVTFHARDGWGNEGTDVFALVVRPPDLQAPTVSPIADQTAVAGSYLALVASASDDDPRFPDGGNFTWTFTYGGAAVHLYGRQTGFTFAGPGDTTVTLVVKDPSGNAAAPVVFLVQVLLPDTTPPTVDAGRSIAVQVGMLVTFEGVATDGGAAILDPSRYNWSFLYNGTTVHLSGATPTFTFEVPGTYEVTLTVLDATGNAAQDHVTITVKPRAPPASGEPSGPNYLLPLALGLAGAAAAAAALLYRRRGRAI